MRIARSLTVSPSMLCSGGGCLGACLLLGEGAWSQEGVWSQGGLVPGRCLVPVGGACSGGGGVVFQHALRQTPLWTEFLTHASDKLFSLVLVFASVNIRLYCLCLTFLSMTTVIAEVNDIWTF